MPARSSGAALPDLVYALYDYCPAHTQSNCLPLFAGTALIVHSRHPSGWWDGELDGKRGWFPSNHVAPLEQMLPRNSLCANDDKADVQTPRVQPVPSKLTDAALLLTSHVRAQRSSLYQSDAAAIRSHVRTILRDINCLHGTDPGAASPIVASRRKLLLSSVYRLVDLTAKLSGDAPRPTAVETKLITCAYTVVSAVGDLLEVAPLPSGHNGVDSLSPKVAPMRPSGRAPALGVDGPALEKDDRDDPRLLFEKMKEAYASMAVVCPIFHRTILAHVRASVTSHSTETGSLPATQQTANLSVNEVVDTTLAVYDTIHVMVPALDRVCLDRQLLRTHEPQLAFIRTTRSEFVHTSQKLLEAVRLLAAAHEHERSGEKSTPALLAAPAMSAASELYRLGKELIGQVKKVVDDLPARRPHSGHSCHIPGPEREKEVGSLSDDGGARRRQLKKERTVPARISLMADSSPRTSPSETQNTLPSVAARSEASSCFPTTSPSTSTTTVASGSANTSPNTVSISLRHKLSLRSRTSSPFSQRHPRMDSLLSKVKRRSMFPEVVHPKPCQRPNDLAPRTLETLDRDEEVVYAPDGTIMGGSLKGLVRTLIPSRGAMDPRFVRTFCLTLPIFSHPAHVAEMVLDRWIGGGAAQRANALAFVRLWMSDAYWRPDLDDPSPLPALSKLATQAGATDLVALVARRYTGRERAEMRVIKTDAGIELVRSIDPPSHSASTEDLYSSPQWSDGPNPTVSRSVLLRMREASAKATDVDPGEMARQLTVLVGRVYASITPEQFWGRLAPSSKAGSRHSQSSSASGLPCPAGERQPLKLLSNLSNSISSWVQTTILACDSIKERTNTLQYFIKLSRKCLLLQNLHVFFSLQFGLYSITVRRLHQTWKGLPGKYQEWAREHEAIVRPGRNHLEYRRLFSNALKSQCPFLPFVAVASGDILFTLEGNSSTRRPSQSQPRACESETINWVRYDRLARIIDDLVSVQRQLYALQAVPEIQTWLLHRFETVTDDGELCQRSLALEPRKPVPSLTGTLSPASAPSTVLSSPRTTASTSLRITGPPSPRPKLPRTAPNRRTLSA